MTCLSPSTLKCASIQLRRQNEGMTNRIPLVKICPFSTGQTSIQQASHPLKIQSHIMSHQDEAGAEPMELLWNGHPGVVSR